LAFDPCRLVRQVKQFVGWCGLAAELLHLPDEPGRGRGQLGEYC
jgi:hypothetical protein